ncbi:MULTISPECIES: amidase [Rhodomicrobium]|uniref:amidase n=1 Tax=Rhodomicrobium TaxID=1068 RepID=UPI000B4BBF4F|nr:MULTISPECIES: amidase [Rhodomicrobium]
MTTSDPALLTLTELAAAIRAKQVSSVEITEALLERIAAWQPATNAFVRIEAEEALALARAADEALARGETKGPLHGVPLAHKDMFYSAGKPVGCGTKLREGWIASTTSTAIARLEAAGAFRLGALHMSECAYNPTGHNPYLGHAHNPWDGTRITGGSSSGSGAAVAARLTPAALGSDTGGSIRLPAHFCGVTGLKTTFGRVSRANALPLSFTLDTVGPLARTAEDCALIMAAMSGSDPLDPATDGMPAWNAAKATRSPQGMTIGLPSSYYVDDLEPEVAAALDRALETFAELGVNIVKVDLPDQTLVASAGLIILAVEATSTHIAGLRERPEVYGDWVRARLENGLAYSAIEYLDALRWRGPALAAHLAAIEGVDAVIAPASREVAPTIAATDVGGPNAEATIIAITRFMRPVNFLGLPGLVVPAGQGETGMPIGLQLIGRPFGDETLTALGTAFQSVTDHHKRVPSLP